VINEELVGNTSSAIMGTDIKGLVGKTEAVHDSDAVISHVALAIEIGVVGGLRRGTIAAEVH
jgi:hypothetical protein